MKISKKNKKRIFIALVILLIPCIAYIIYYFSYYKPIKDEVIKIAVEYVQFADSGYMLPNEYQEQPDKMPQSEIDKLKESCKNKFETFFTKDSDYGNREYTNFCEFIDELVAKKFSQISSITKIKEVNKIEIKNNNTALVTLVTNTLLKSDKDGDVRSYNTSYTLVLIKENESWKIKDITFRPLGI